MTSMPLAPTRPAPIFRPPRALPPSLKTDPEVLDSATDRAVARSEDDSARSAKRRKIDSSSNTSSPSAIPARGIAQNEKPSGDVRAVGVLSGPWRFSDSFLVSVGEKVTVEDESPLPLPSRPWQHPLTAKPKEEPKPTGRVRKKIPIPNTPDKVESPSDACKFGKCALAGFFPWTGKHPEDILSESNVRHGYFDRPPNPPEKEMGSARNALSSVFKHRSGLDTLSVLLGLTLERKCKIGTFPSMSNFRPPPRVTLTEARRKAWLADLADIELPLRRLSRTIPQGLRGQALLDQCLSNMIPIARALWFIKCVGANEIRTLKRKGPGGAITGGSETKWLKEWTSSVANFLETTLQQSTEPNSKKNMQYALRLTCQLYFENLVHRDTFLDWIVKAYTAADHDRTPFFLLLVQMYLPDLIRFRRRSRRLASSLVEKLELTSKTDEEVLLPLIVRLKVILRSFAMSRPVCFIMPEKWPQCKNILRICLDLNDADHQKLFHYIELHNERTAASLAEQGRDLTRPQQAIIKLLDQSKAPYNAKSILTSCTSLCQDVDLLLLTVLRWATSRYRTSKHQLYLAVRLLRMWDAEGDDVESALISFIAASSRYATNPASLQQLYAELSRSQTFSVSKYLQSMIVRGSNTPDSFVDSTYKLKCALHSGQIEVIPQICRDSSQVLTEVSLKHLPDHVRNLRKLVLARAGYRADVEGVLIRHCQTFLSNKFSFASKSLSNTTGNDQFSVPPWSSLSWSIKCQTSTWLRDYVRAQCKVDKDPTQPLRSSHRITADDFCVIRDTLEEMGDLAVLADVLDLITRVPQESLLALVVDTIDRHADVLSAMGAFGDLQEKTCTAYLTLRTSKLPLTTLATSILSMNHRYPTKAISTRLLRQDVVQGDRGSAAAACSPFSDGVAESLQQAGSHFFDDFEAIVQTETNMNAQTMDKLFAVLLKRIEKQNLDKQRPQELRSLCELLARLRLCRLGQATVLIKGWVEQQIRQRDWRATSVLLVDLVGTRCLRFGTIVECMQEIMKDPTKQTPALLALLESLFTPQSVESDAVSYRFDTERLHYIRENSPDVLDLLARIGPPEVVSSTIGTVIEASINTAAFSEIPLLNDISQQGKGYIQHKINSLLTDDPRVQSGTVDGTDAVALADDFSYPICKLSLRLQTSGTAARSADELGEAFLRTAVNTRTPDFATQQWTSLLLAAGSQTARYVRLQAEEAFFASVPPLLQNRSITVPVDASRKPVEVATRYLDIAFAAGDALSEYYNSSVTGQLIEKFSIAHRMLSNTTASVTSPMATTTLVPGLGLTSATATPSLPSPDVVAAICEYLPLLLRMACLQRQNANTSLISLAKAAQQEQIKLTVLLTTLALHPVLNNTDLPARTSAVISTLITQPQFTEEMHAYCARLLKDKMRDPRVMFLFGSVNMCGSGCGKDLGEGLQLYKEGMGRAGEWKQWVRNWEVIEPSGGGEDSSWVGLGMFDARRV